MNVPLLQRHQIRQIKDIISHNMGKPVVSFVGDVNNFTRVFFGNDELFFLGYVLTQNRSCNDNVAVSHSQRSHHTTLSAQENKRLIEHNSPRDIPNKRGGRFVTVRGKIKMNI